MRVAGFSIVVLGALTATGSEEPSEAAMRAAFETTLAAQVQSAVDFAVETGGQEALDRIRAAHTEEFDIRDFRKLDCSRSVAQIGHVCEFAVRIGVVSGTLRRKVIGRFYTGSRGLVFDYEAVGPNDA